MPTTWTLQPDSAGDLITHIQAQMLDRRPGICFQGKSCFLQHVAMDMLESHVYLRYTHTAEDMIDMVYWALIKAAAAKSSGATLSAVQGSSGTSIYC